MPNPQAKAIAISERQKNILEQITRRTTNPYRLVRRAQLILLAAKGVNNSKISQQLQLQRNQVRLWRKRWQLAKECLRKIEAEGSSDTSLKEGIINVLRDKLRRGSNPKFTVEQIVQIVAIACSDPGQSERPVTHWTPKELADEAVKRGIVEKISPRTVGRFLSMRLPSNLIAVAIGSMLILMTLLLLGNKSERSASYI